MCCPFCQWLINSAGKVNVKEDAVQGLDHSVGEACLSTILQRHKSIQDEICTLTAYKLELHSCWSDFKGYCPQLLMLLQELELLESKSQGIKTKAETQAKYGW